MFSDDAARGYPCVCVLGEERFKRVCVCVFEHEPVHALFRSDTRIPPTGTRFEVDVEPNRLLWKQDFCQGSSILGLSDNTKGERGGLCFWKAAISFMKGALLLRQ